MDEPKEFKSLFKDLFDKLYYTDIPPKEFSETEKEYKMFCKNYRKVFDVWVEKQWSLIDTRKEDQKVFMPYVNRDFKKGSDSVYYGVVYEYPSLELEPRHRVSTVTFLSESKRVPLGILMEYCNTAKEDETNYLWVNLYNNPKRIETIRGLLSFVVTHIRSKYLSVNICNDKHQGMVLNTLLPRIEPVNLVWGLEGKTKSPFPAKWEPYFQDGLIYRDWHVLLNGDTTFKNYPGEIGCPCFYKEFIEIKKTFDFPRSINLKYPAKHIIDVYDEWKASNLHIKIFAMDKSTEVTAKDLKYFFDKHFLAFKSYLEENDVEGCISYYFCGVATYYQLFNLAFVFNEYFRVYTLSKTSPEGDLNTMWKNVAPLATIGTARKIDVNDLIDISYYRPNHQYSKWFRYLRAIWMSTFSMYSQEFWLDRVASFGGSGSIAIPAEKPVDTSSVEWWEYTVYHFIKEYPINNVVYPDFVSRIKMDWNSPRSFEDLDAFDKLLKDWETAAANPFWTACAHQWDIYIGWIELNIMSGFNIDGYKQPMSSLGKDERDLEITNIYPNIGVLQDDTDASTWSILKIPGTITWTATFIFGGSWLSKITAYIKQVFITCLKALKEIAIAGIAVAKEAGKEVAGFISDFLAGGKSYIFMAAAGAILLLGLAGATEKKIKNIF